MLCQARQMLSSAYSPRARGRWISGLSKDVSWEQRARPSSVTKASSARRRSRSAGGAQVPDFSPTVASRGMVGRERKSPGRAGRGPRPAAPVIESPTGRPPRMRLLTPGLGLSPAPEILRTAGVDAHQPSPSAQDASTNPRAGALTRPRDSSHHGCRLRPQA